MIGTSVTEYIFIRICILALRAITPVSIFYCSLSIADPPRHPFTRFLLGWAILETVFWLLVFLPRKRTLQARASHPSPLPREQRQELFWKCWDRIPNPEYYLSKWFMGARSWEIRRDNVSEFFAWALLNHGEEDKAKKEEEEEEADIARRGEVEKELNEYVDGVQTLLGRPIEAGRGSAKSLRLTIDEVKMLHRPVVWYLVRFGL
jgi:hypothetical protein